MPSNLPFPSTSKVKTTGVAYIRPELADMFVTYRRIRDCVSGEPAVKKARQTYLPKPNATDNSRENATRYDAYITRAEFYPATGRTLYGLIGQIFMREPTLALPSTLEALKDDASGDGQTLEQVARSVAGFTLGHGRCGLLVDYPDTTGADADNVTTVDDLDTGRVRPTIKVFEPWSIVNWRSIFRNSEEILTLVVILEAYEYDDDGFEKKTRMQYRELRLVDNVYTVRTHYKSEGSSEWNISAPYTPLDGSGKPFDTIQFKFVGAINNNSSIDNAPLDAIAGVNVAHYRNSADYEDSVFICGQPTIVVVGLTKEWIDNVFEDEPILLGSRRAINLPVGGDAKLIQAEANMIVKEAMEAKERHMVALGARLVQQATVQRTATETSAEDATDNSVLSAVSKNVSTAMLWALKSCGRFVGTETGIEYKLSSEFDLAVLSSEDIKSIISTWQAGAIAFTEMRSMLRQGGRATLPDEEAAAAIAKETAEAMALAMAMAPEPGTPGAPKPGAPPKPTPTNQPKPGKGALNK